MVPSVSTPWQEYHTNSHIQTTNSFFTPIASNITTSEQIVWFTSDNFLQDLRSSTTDNSIYIFINSVQSLVLFWLCPLILARLRPSFWAAVAQPSISFSVCFFTEIHPTLLSTFTNIYIFFFNACFIWKHFAYCFIGVKSHCFPFRISFSSKSWFVTVLQLHEFTNQGMPTSPGTCR